MAEEVDSDVTDRVAVSEKRHENMDIDDLLEQASLLQTSFSSHDLILKVTQLTSELESAHAELRQTVEKLERVQRLYDQATLYNLDMKKQLVELTVELVRLKQHAENTGLAVTTDTSTQTDEVTTDTAVSAVETAAADWGQSDTVTSLKEESIADSIKATAEAAVQGSGYVYDEKTGLYYDYSTGYYYDSAKNLHYEPMSGTYYFYNADTKQYEFHSQVDTSQVQEHSFQQPDQGVDTSCDHRRRGNEQSYSSHRSGRYRSDRDTKYERGDRREKNGREASDRKRELSDRDKRRESPERLRRRGNDDHRRNEKRSRSESRDEKRGRHSSKHSHKRDEKQSRHRSKKKKTEEKKDNRSNHKSLDASCTEKEDADAAKEIRNADENGEKTADSAVCEDGELEEGELSSGDGSLHEDVSSADCHSECDEAAEEEEEEAHLPEEDPVTFRPCIRAIVVKSAHLDLGSLYILTCVGGTIGREESLSHAVLIPDEHVSKVHCEILYNEDLQRYTVTDKGSQGGTYVNKKRLSKPKVVSAPQAVYNGDSLQVGRTTFDLHIHPGTETCDGCEPGLIQASLQQEEQEEKVFISKAEKEKLRRQELKTIKKKFGLQDSAYVDDTAAINNPNYTDKASERRRLVGSDNPYQKDDAPASVERAISKENKGHKMLAKMGWKEGESLGKTQGITEPVKVKMRPKASAGLGTYTQYEGSLDNVRDMRNTEKWIKTQERYKRCAEVAEEEAMDEAGGEGGTQDGS